MSRDGHHGQAVNVPEFGCGLFGSTRHAAQPPEKAKKLLKTEPGQRFAGIVHRKAFLGFYGLMQSMAPGPVRHQPVWVDVLIPPSASPGSYRGYVRVTAENAGVIVLPVIAMAQVGQIPTPPFASPAIVQL